MEKTGMDIKRWSKAALLGLAGTMCLPVIVRSADAMTMGNSVLSFFFFLFLTGVEYRAVQEARWGKRDLFLCLVFSFGFCLSMAFGRSLTFLEYVEFTDLSMWLSVFVLSAVFTPIVRWAANRLGQAWTKAGEGGVSRRAQAYSRQRSLSPRTRFFLLSAVFFLCWIPVLLAVWPGFFVYDATDEVRQVLEGVYNDRHPLLHVLLLGNLVKAGFALTGSYNAGIVCFMLLQMLFCALCFSWLLGLLKRLGAGRAVLAVSFVFLAFFPVIQMYVLCSSKDTAYALFMLLVMGLLTEMGRDREDFFRKKTKLIALGLSLYGMAEFRNNGFYVFLVMIPALLFAAGKGKRRRTALLLGAVLVCVLGTNGLLNAALKPQSTGAMETLTVPIQQLTRAYELNREVFGPEDEETLLSVLPAEAMAKYRPQLSDPVKIDFRSQVFQENPIRYLKLWAKIGLRCPFTYLNAWLSTSYGFWYPDAMINVYKGNVTHTVIYEDSSYFGFETEEPGVRDSKIPLLEKLYRKLSLDVFQQKIPVVSMLFSPGFLFWVYAFFLLCHLRRRRLMPVVVLLPAMLNWLTVLLGPTYLVRYVLIFWFALPVVLCSLREQ